MLDLKNIILLGFFFELFFVSLNTNAQTLKQIINQIREHDQQMTDYKVYLTYKLYEYPYMNVKDVKKGVFYRRNKKFYLKLGEVEMLYTPSLNLKINHNEKAILLANSNISSLPLSFTIDNFPNTKKSLSSNAKYRIITIKAGKISQFPYTKIVFYFDKKQLLLHKVSFYLPGRIKRDEKTNKPKLINYRLDLYLTNYQFDYNHQHIDSKFLPSKYLLLNKDKVKGIGPLSNYVIIDIRKKHQ